MDNLTYLQYLLILDNQDIEQAIQLLKKLEKTNGFYGFKHQLYSLLINNSTPQQALKALVELTFKPTTELVSVILNKGNNEDLKQLYEFQKLK